MTLESPKYELSLLYVTNYKPMTMALSGEGVQGEINYLKIIKNVDLALSISKALSQ